MAVFLFKALLFVFLERFVALGEIMLVSFSVGNTFSFNSVQTLHMEAVSSRKDDINLENVQTLVFNPSVRLLESALIFGANASGKSNFIRALALFRQIVLRSQSILDEEEMPALALLPFLLNTENLTQPNVMEVVFYVNETRYRYGLELSKGQVHREWFFYTPTIRETLLFERNQQEVQINREGFTEALPFVKDQEILRTRSVVPFVSVLASENGEHSLNLVNWFNKIAVISGVYEDSYMAFTKRLIEEDQQFKGWLTEVLGHFQISGVELSEVTVQVRRPNTMLDVAEDWDKKSGKTVKSKQIVVLKQVEENGQKTERSFPLSIESEGTRKLIHLLGPIYDAIKNQRILIIDEFEAKFHSLLSKYLFKIFHLKNTAGGQIIAAVHDTSLMDTKYFRRDQVWLVDKNTQGASELYSLVEFKEKSRQLKRHYGDEYLQGAFGAVALFEDQNALDKVM